MKNILTLILLMTLLTCALCSKDENTNTAKSISCENLVNDPVTDSDSFYIYPVSAFTPNADGLNDRFWIYYSNIKSFKLTVYDENSNILFYTEDINKQWDPNSSSVISRAFFYRIEATSTTNKRIGKCGEVYPLNCVPLNNTYHFQDEFDGRFFDIPTTEYNICP